jgi:predicted small metal-binding protein
MAIDDQVRERESSLGSGQPMAKQIKCECGFVAHGQSEDEVVDVIRAHMAADHPDLVGKVSRDDLVGWIEEN